MKSVLILLLMKFQPSGVRDIPIIYQHVVPVKAVHYSEVLRLVVTQYPN